MSNLEVTPKESDNYRECLSSAFESKSLQAFLNCSKSGLNAFNKALSILKEHGKNVGCHLFILQILENFVQELHASAVIIIENNFADLLKDFCQKDNKICQELKNLLEMSLGMFQNEARQEQVPLLSSIYEKTFPKTNFYSQKNIPSIFDDLYISSKKVINLYSKGDETEYSNDVLLSGAIAIIEKINANREKVNFLEKELLKNCFNKLCHIKDSLEQSKENTNESIQKKKNKKIVLDSLPSEMQLKNRTFFFKDEQLPFEENEEDEYKEYSLPLSEYLEKTLAKVVCSYLNRRGGRIYIGVNDKRIVKGIRVNYSQRKEVQDLFERIFSSLDPDPPSKKPFRILYLPVLDSKTNIKINNLFIVKIIVCQGDTSILYSASKESLQCYIRYEGKCAFMSAKETREALIGRFLNPSPPVAEELFFDPEPEEEKSLNNKTSEKLDTTKISSNGQNNPHNKIPKDKDSNNSSFKCKTRKCSKEDGDSKFEEVKINKTVENKINDNKNRKVSQKNYYPEMVDAIQNINVGGENLLKLYEVFVEGLPLNWTLEEFNNFADSLKYKSLFSTRMFRSEHGVCNGKAFFNFKDKEEANHFITMFNGSSLFGKQMLVTFKK